MKKLRNKNEVKEIMKELFNNKKAKHYALATVGVVALVGLLGLAMGMMNTNSGSTIVVPQYTGGATGAAVITVGGDDPGTCVIGPDNGKQGNRQGNGVIKNAQSVCDSSVEGCGGCLQLCLMFDKINDKAGCPLDGADGFCNPDVQETDPDCCGRNGQCNAVCGTGAAPKDPDCSWPQTPRGIGTAMDFISLNEGWGVGSQGIIRHTTDGGATVTFQTIPNPANTQQNAVDFVDNTHGWIVGRGINNFVRIWSTTDGGATWNLQLDGLAIGVGGDLTDVSFVDRNHGWAVGGGVNSFIFKTIDGGATWTSSFFDQVGAEAAGSSIHFQDLNNGWTTKKRTTDGGVTWTTMPPAVAGGFDFATSDIDCVDLQNCWRVGNVGVERTADGGLSWTQVLTGAGGLANIDFVDVNNGWAVGAKGILHTNDGGITWTQQIDDSHNERFNDIQMFDVNNGFAIGFRGLFRTTTGGN